MAEFIKLLFLMSAKASLIIGMILFTKYLLGKFFNAKTHYYIWFVVIFSLTFPYTLIDLENITEVFKIDAYQYSENHQNVNINLNLDKDISNLDVKNYSIERNSSAEYENIDSLELYFSSNVINVISWIWLIGFILFGSLNIFNFIVIGKSISMESEISDFEVLTLFNNCKAKFGIADDIKLVKTTRFSTPSVWGYYPSVVLLPKEMLEKLKLEKLELIFMHELAHIKRRDVLINWVILIYQTIYWFNPIVLIGLSNMKNDIELVCDEMVLKNIESEKYLEYGYIIIELLEYLRMPCLTKSAMGFLKDKNELKRRIVMIKTYRDKFGRTSIVGILIVLVIALVSTVGCESKDGNTDSSFGKISKKNMEMIYKEAEEYSIELYNAQKIVDENNSMVGLSLEDTEKEIGKSYESTYYLKKNDIDLGKNQSVLVYPIKDQMDKALYVLFENDKLVECIVDKFDGNGEKESTQYDYIVKAYDYETGDIEESKLFNNGQEFDLEKLKEEFIGRDIANFKDKFGFIHGFTEVLKKDGGMRLSVYPITLDYSSPTPALFIISENGVIKDIKLDGAWGALQFERLDELFDISK